MIRAPWPPRWPSRRPAQYAACAADLRPRPEGTRSGGAVADVATSQTIVASLLAPLILQHRCPGGTVIRSIIVPYDDRTQYAGTSASVTSWKKITQDDPVLLLQRHRNDIVRLLLEAAVRDVYEGGGYPLV